MITQNLRRLSQLHLRLTASYIYLENHQIKINPKRDGLSYQNPKIAQNKPPVRYEVPLNRKIQRKIDEKKFKQYRDRMIVSNKRDEAEYEPHPIWEGEQPIHYFSNLGMSDYLNVPSISHRDFVYVPRIFQPNVDLVAKVDFQNLKQYSIHHLVQIALKMKAQRIVDGEKWFKLDELVDRKLHNLSVDEVLQLKFALAASNRKKFGSEQHHKILNDLIEGDADQMNLEQLIAAMCSVGTNPNNRLQQFLIEKIFNNPQMFAELNNSPQMIVAFVRAFADYRPLIPQKNILKRKFNQVKSQRQGVLNKLNLTKHIPNIPIADVVHLTRNLFELQVEGVKDIMVLIHQRLFVQAKQLDPFQAFEVAFSLQKVDGGEVLSQQLYSQLQPTFLNNWDKFTDLHKIKIIYCYWNLSIWDDFIELYKQIPVTDNSSMLYYFAQIEMIDSTQRQAEVLRAIGKLDYIPLPYYYRYRQFCNHLKAEFPDWDLRPLDMKFFQTQEYFTPYHLLEKVVSEPYFQELGQFLSTMPLKFEPLIVVENSEFAPYAMTDNHICVDVIFERHFIPGTNIMKKAATLKAKSMLGMKWMQIGIRWSTFREKPRSEQIKWVEQTFKKAIEYQQEVRKIEHINRQKSIMIHHLMRFFKERHPEDLENLASDPRLADLIADSTKKPVDWERLKYKKQMVKELKAQGVKWAERMKKADDWEKDLLKKEKEEKERLAEEELIKGLKK